MKPSRVYLASTEDPSALRVSPRHPPRSPRIARGRGAGHSVSSTGRRSRARRPGHRDPRRGAPARNRLRVLRGTRKAHQKSAPLRQGALDRDLTPVGFEEAFHQR